MLLGATSDWVRANRLEAVREAAAAGRAVVLLKGADTLIADARRSGRVVVGATRPGWPPPAPATC